MDYVRTSVPCTAALIHVYLLWKLWNIAIYAITSSQKGTGSFEKDALLIVFVAIYSLCAPVGAVQMLRLGFIQKKFRLRPAHRNLLTAIEIAPFFFLIPAMLQFKTWELISALPFLLFSPRSEAFLQIFSLVVTPALLALVTAQNLILLWRFPKESPVLPTV